MPTKEIPTYLENHEDEFAIHFAASFFTEEFYISLTELFKGLLSLSLSPSLQKLENQDLFRFYSHRNPPILDGFS